MSKPERPADPRPDGEPYYIDSECPEHGVELEQDPQSLSEGFHDEFVCSECGDGIHFVDWPEEHWEDGTVPHLTKADDFVPLDDL